MSRQTLGLAAARRRRRSGIDARLCVTMVPVCRCRCRSGGRTVAHGSARSTCVDGAAQSVCGAATKLPRPQVPRCCLCRMCRCRCRTRHCCCTCCGTCVETRHARRRRDWRWRPWPLRDASAACTAAGHLGGSRHAHATGPPARRAVVPAAGGQLATGGWQTHAAQQPIRSETAAMLVTAWLQQLWLWGCWGHLLHKPAIHTYTDGK